MTTLQTIDDLILLGNDITKSAAAKLLYPDTPYDTSLPQPWVDACRDEHNFDVRPCVVWGYGPGNALGAPLPLTSNADAFLKRIGW
jgi:hypothetical protein